MRMRKKKYLDERLKAVSDILFISNIEDRNFNTAAEKKEFIDFDKWVDRRAPYMLAIGCGKGGFAKEFARRNPDINLIAVEKDANVIVSACEKIKEDGIKNVRFIKCSAE